MLSKSLFFAALLPLASSSPIEVNEPAFSDFDITAVQFSGSGCPQGSNSASLSGGWQSSTVAFKQFGGSETENCQVHFQGSGATPGYQVTLSEVDVVGSVVLKAGTTFNSFVQAYWSQDAAKTTTVESRVENPENGDYDRAFTLVGKLNPVWSKCVGADGNPGILNVNFRVALNGGGKFEVNKENLRFKWRKC